MRLAIKLKMLRACRDARDWAEPYEAGDDQLAWDQCDKPEWLMWLLAATSLPGSDRRCGIGEFLQELSPEAWDEEMDQNAEHFCDFDCDDAAGLAHDFITNIINVYASCSKQELLKTIRSHWPNPPVI